MELSTYNDQRESAFRLLKLLSEWHLISWSSWRTPIAARGIVFASDATLDDNILTRIQRYKGRRINMLLTRPKHFAARSIKN